MTEHTFSGEDLILVAVVGGAFIAVCISALVVSFRLRSAIESAYAELARETGMEVITAEPRLWGLLKKYPALHGIFQGRDCAVHCVGYGLDNTRQTDTAIRMESDFPKDVQFTLTARNKTGKLAQSARGKEVPTGNDAFDQRYLLKSRDPERLRKTLKAEQIKLMSELLEPNGMLKLDEGVIVYTETGLLRSQEGTRHWLNKLKQVHTLADR